MAKARTTTVPFTLPPLPWKENALAPVISADTVRLHHEKHHKGYVDNLNRLVADSPLSELPLEDLVRYVADTPDQKAVFDNAVEAWNHAFYWQSLAPHGGGRPAGVVSWKIDHDFGGYDTFKQQLTHAALRQSASGWLWLVHEGDMLRVRRTANAETPMVQGRTCLLAIDVCEHAYSLDYHNRRAAYVEAVIDKLLNWHFAAQQLAQAESEHFVG